MKSLLKELEQARGRVAELERKAEQERRDLLAGLPAKYGFASYEEFADAVRVAAGLKPIYEVAEVSSELEASKAATPYWREASETETAPTTFVAQGIQASRSAQASRPASEEPVPANESAPASIAAPAVSTTENVAQQPTAEVAPTPPPRPLPTGTSLSDPSNFGLLPDNALLERGDKSEENFRMQLNTATIFAQQVMHTSRVPAAVWRAWRDFARKAGEVLRGSGVQVA
jgi:hypothetical protein